MSKQRLSNIEELINALEIMIDARDDMWQEEQYHNHKEFLRIKDTVYEPAKDDVRWYLKRVIEETIYEERSEEAP